MGEDTCQDMIDMFGINLFMNEKMVDLIVSRLVSQFENPNKRKAYI